MTFSVISVIIFIKVVMSHVKHTGELRRKIRKIDRLENTCFNKKLQFTTMLWIEKSQ